jgi:hypothetical protein
MHSEEDDILKIDRTKITVVEKLPDFSNDPFFLKKEEEAYNALTEVPLPDIILERIEGPSILKKIN